MPAMGGRGGGLMVPRGGMGRRSSCYPGGSGMGGPAVHSTARRASSRSEAGIGLFPGMLVVGGSKNPKNTSEENVIGSKYLLVPSQISAGYPGSTLQNSHILTHQHSLPNHHVGYHRGSVAERSSSIISEHSVTSETPPMIGGGINTSLDADSTDQFWPSSNHQYKHLNDIEGRRKSTVKGHDIPVNTSTLNVLPNETTARSSSIVNLGPESNRLPLLVKEGEVEIGRRRPNHPRPSWFQCYLCLGLVGFVTFWIVLMLRVYLHERYWTWSYIW